MGFFDIFRKKPKEYTLQEVKAWLKNKQLERKQKESSVKNAVIKHTEQLIFEVQEGLKIFLNADISKHSVEQRVKVIVQGNIKKYAFYIEQLIKELQKEKESAVDLLDHIHKSFLDFEHKSAKSFYKSTYLVGEELEPIKKSFKNYTKEIKEIQEENEAIFDRRYAQIAELIKDIESKHESHKELETKLKEKEKEHTMARQLLDETKKGNEYKGREEKIKIKQKIEQEITKKISKLKEAIDFRYLAKTFHGEKKYEDVKHYKEDFSRVLQDPKPIFELMKLAHLEVTPAQEIYSAIKILEKDIPKIPVDPTIKIHEKIAIVEYELKKIQESISKAHKNIEEEKKEKEEKKKKLTTILLEKGIHLNT
jgi:hypothetical protein